MAASSISIMVDTGKVYGEDKMPEAVTSMDPATKIPINTVADVATVQPLEHSGSGSSKGPASCCTASLAARKVLAVFEQPNAEGFAVVDSANSNVGWKTGLVARLCAPGLRLHTMHCYCHILNTTASQEP